MSDNARERAKAIAESLKVIAPEPLWLSVGVDMMHATEAIATALERERREALTACLEIANNKAAITRSENYEYGYVDCATDIAAAIERLRDTAP